MKCSLLEKIDFSPCKNRWLLHNLSSFCYTALRNVFKKFFWSYYILHSIYSSKIDRSVIFSNKKIPVWLVARGSVMVREIAISYKSIYFSNIYFILRLHGSIRSEPVRKKTLISSIIRDLLRNYRMPANKKGEFCMVGSRGRLVKLKALRVEEAF